MDNQPVLSKAEGPVQGQNTGVPQTPVSPTPIPPPPAVQPPQTPPSGPEALRAGGPKSRKKILFLLLLAVLIAIVAGYLFLSSKKPFEDTTGLAAKVGEQKITVSQASEFANECSLEQKEAAEYLVDNIVLEQWAQDEKIAFSKEDQKAEEIRISGKEATINCIAVQAKVNLLRERLTNYATPFREGKFIVVNFGRYNPSPFGLQPVEATQGADLQELLEKEREYADSLVNSIYDDLKANKLTFEQAIEKVNNDPKVGTSSPYKTFFQSGTFAANDYIKRNGLFASDSFKQKVDSLDEGKATEPFLEQVNVAPCDEPTENCKPTYTDSHWIIAKVEKLGKGYGDPSEELIVKIRDKYDAKIYLR